tara:strand:- start:270 stop:677 length:408 start_codon:yes stop_codon:yes gene_type:complete
MKIRSSTDSEAKMEITPLIDILFTLIIFFLATSTFQEEENPEDINLPDSTNRPPSKQEKFLVINIDKDGRFRLGSSSVKLDVLKQALEREHKANPQTKVKIRGDHDALHGNVSKVLLACKNAGFTTANIAYHIEQ